MSNDDTCVLYFTTDFLKYIINNLGRLMQNFCKISGTFLSQWLPTVHCMYVHTRYNIILCTWCRIIKFFSVFWWFANRYFHFSNASYCDGCILQWLITFAQIGHHRNIKVAQSRNFFSLSKSSPFSYKEINIVPICTYLFCLQQFTCVHSIEVCAQKHKFTQ